MAKENTTVAQESFYDREKIVQLLKSIMRKHQYHFIGESFAVKLCRWTKSAILGEEFCYKCKFYGIESHRCIQMTPAALWCWNACIHCWRVRAQDLGLDFKELVMPEYNEDINSIVEEIVSLQRKLLSGYWGNPKANRKLLEEASNPKHVAISLSGEPTLYRRLPELIRAFHRQGLTTFLVTRGVRPDVLESLDELPTQTYLSVESYSKEMYEWLNKPLVPRAWELTWRSIKVLREYNRPTALRITLIKEVNMSEKAIEGFKKIVEDMQPTFIEVKAYMHVGMSVHRLSKRNMPSYEDVFEFSKKLSKTTGYPIRSASRPSRVVLLSMLEKPIRYGRGCPEGWEFKEA